MNKEKLINKINQAFKSVQLEEGIGLWEAQGHDDRLTAKECRELRKKDEKEDWSKIQIIDLYTCSSSLSFFDAKGMRFHTPMFLLLALNVFEKEEKELNKKGSIQSCLEPDIEFHLLSGLAYLKSDNEIMKNYSEEQFSLFNVPQIECIVEFLKYRMKEMEEHYSNKYAKELGTNPDAVIYDKDYIQLKDGVNYWAKKI
ncbi:DUF6714 family protein [Aquimarina sp. SS2-1]|uniref:DUF6714 family protein n=1 Tax=Aquimarina besae TaxID=3342247 RepID=UPI00366B566E